MSCRSDRFPGKITVVLFHWYLRNKKEAVPDAILEWLFYNFRTNNKLKVVASKRSLGRYTCKLLNEDMDKPVSQVCFESGYNNFVNFNRQFKEITNSSPKEYRQRVR